MKKTRPGSSHDLRMAFGIDRPALAPLAAAGLLAVFAGCSAPGGPGAAGNSWNWRPDAGAADVPTLSAGTISGAADLHARARLRGDARPFRA